MVVAQVAVGVEEGEGAERAAAGDERHHRGRVVAGVVHQLQVLGVLGDLVDHLRRLQVAPDHRLVQPQHLGHRVLAGRVERLLPADPFQPRRHLRVGAGDDAVAVPAVGPAEVDQAELRQLRHRGGDDRPRRLGRVERAVEQAAGGDEELLGAPSPHLGGDVAGDDRGADQAAHRAADRRDGERDGDAGAVGADPLGLVGLEAFAALDPVEDHHLLVLVVGGTRKETWRPIASSAL